MAEDDLQKRLERLGQQVLTDIEAWEQRTRAERAQVLDRLTHTLEDKLGRAVDQLAEKEARRKEREERRAERKARREKENEPSVAGGIVFLVVAAICAAIGLTHEQQFWMVFVALGFGLSGASQLTAVARKRRELPAASTPEPVKAPVVEKHEVDVLCDQLLAELADAPPPIRSFVSEPEKTIASMRATLKSLDQRRKQLAAEDAKGRLEELARQRQSLTERRDAATDPETRGRMDDALRSLSGQQAALEHLKVMTERVDGEHTSLLVHLQELRTRISVAKSTSSPVEVDGVKASVKRLGDELSAISEAMEAVHRGDLSPVSEVGDAPQGTKDPSRVAD